MHAWESVHTDTYRYMHTYTQTHTIKSKIELKKNLKVHGKYSVHGFAESSSLSIVRGQRLGKRRLWRGWPGGQAGRRQRGRLFQAS